MSLRSAQIVWFAFIVWAALIILIAHFLHPRPAQVPAASLKWVLAVIAAADLVILGSVRRTFLERSREKSQRGEASQAQAAWSLAQMLGFAGCLSVVLFGFVLSVMGAAPNWFSAIFYIVGIARLIMWSPRP